MQNIYIGVSCWGGEVEARSRWAGFGGVEGTVHQLSQREIVMTSCKINVEPIGINVNRDKWICSGFDSWCGYDYLKAGRVQTLHYLFMILL